MGYVFIGGIPCAGKSYLAEKIAKENGMIHVNPDFLREEMEKDKNLEPWVNFFRNLDEEKYLESTTAEKHWENIRKQSEAFWPLLLEKIESVRKNNQFVIFETENILPHLALRDLDFPGVYLLGESVETIFERNKLSPRWGSTEDLQRKEAEMFFDWVRPILQKEAEDYGYKTFSNAEEAEKEIL
ncbi:MAG: hypothetical protein UW87_C0036G0001, partial [Candidatus Moranbacteria bacterium GW2011_GWC2_45_10]